LGLSQAQDSFTFNLKKKAVAKKNSKWDYRVCRDIISPTLFQAFNQKPIEKQNRHHQSKIYRYSLVVMIL